MFWDLHQQAAIDNTKAQLQQMEYDASSKEEQLNTKINSLEDRVENLMMACQAMWELLSQNNQIGEKDLLAKIEEVDLRSGARDGKFPGKGVTSCTGCGRKNGPRHKTCLYCGHDIASGNIPHMFDL